MAVGLAVGPVGLPRIDLLTCIACGLTFARPSTRGQRPRRCPECRPLHVAEQKRSRVNRLDTNTAGYRLSLAVTTYRLAIEEAACALRLGRAAEALAALDRVQAPARATR